MAADFDLGSSEPSHSERLHSWPGLSQVASPVALCQAILVLYWRSFAHANRDVDSGDPSDDGHHLRCLEPESGAHPRVDRQQRHLCGGWLASHVCGFT
jgi:hypothetical protein